MRTAKTVDRLRQAVRAARQEGKTIGLVPTMGFLHAGHMSLVDRARRETDLVVVSIFVNPAQFGPSEDFEAYPRDEERDLAMLEEAGVDLVFMPSAEEMYPEGFATYVLQEGSLTETLCGRSRPGHFRGVTTIVAKLFNLVGPDRAYFGQKDAQQVAVIRRMVKDLNFDVRIVACPIVREDDGLALSSRNTYLDSRQRQDATVLSRALFEARAAIEAGQRRAAAIRELVRNRIAAVADARIDYVEVVDADDLTPLEKLQGRIMIAVAVRIGKPRLIDNIQMTVDR